MEKKGKYTKCLNYIINKIYNRQTLYPTKMEYCLFKQTGDITKVDYQDKKKIQQLQNAEHRDLFSE